MVIRLSCERRNQLDIAAITGVSQGAISKIPKRSRETGPLTKDLTDIAKYRQML